MKKKFFALFALLLIPTFALFGCGKSQSFYIYVQTSNASLGTPTELSQYPYEKGSTVTISTSETEPDKNPFLCWVKDTSRVVSTKKSFDIVVDENTQGLYSAVFEGASQMNFATLTGINYTGSEYASFSYTVHYAPSNNLTQKTLLCQGSSSAREMNTFSNDVFYLRELEGPAGRTLVFTITIKATTANGDKTFNFPAYTDIHVSNSDFGGGLTFNVPTGDGAFEFEFSKLHKGLFE